MTETKYTRGKHPNSLKTVQKNKIKPGEVRNPNGRPVGAKGHKTAIAEIMDAVVNANEIGEVFRDLLPRIEEQYGRKVTRREMLAYVMTAKALSGDVYAFEKLADREEGKATQKIDADIGKKTTELTDEELDELIKQKIASGADE